MDYFVDKNSVVRQIWGNSDTILFIFAGASAEFALNKAVDWLYFTGKLPADPLGRLFSTVAYAQRIVFSDRTGAYRAIDKMREIHASVEASRGAAIPDWAYRDVLFMLIYYSVRAFELLNRKLTNQENEEIYQVFYAVGERMGIKDLPANYQAWLPVHAQHLQQDLQKSAFTSNLFQQYRKHLGTFRYLILREAQTMVAPPRVNELLGKRKISLLYPILYLYKASRVLKTDWLLKEIIFPAGYKSQIKGLDKSLS
ncbi:hypothetical protein AAE02nite_50190 [Adhaeribacter aerolatus]|uniref:ER-bound oxygenase mpaB/mpaB'/Rubber oxygenase catalytic domain-containing protein n=1 Tax=Adhaeribacter aerolatus TaxID=670289 RepID=A0A512B5W0_9BACT|nr:oxygenase MpaB family protein [Adhaeribacter aerolatus]GEO07355.1 hypothetical protein AAE02nite_50190 [Adhaeribacter aerolatus]